MKTKIAVLLIAVLALVASCAVIRSQQKPQTVAEKMNDRLYDARRDGLKSLSFRVKIDRPNNPGGKSEPFYAQVNWQAPDTLNFIPETADGKPREAHPYFSWYMYFDHVQQFLPLGGPTLATKGTPTTKPLAGRGYLVQFEHPIYRNGKLMITLIHEFETDKNYTPTVARETGVKGGPQTHPSQVTTYQLFDNGYCMPAEIRFYRSKRSADDKEETAETRVNSVTYTKIGGFWLPTELRKKPADEHDFEAALVTFTDYKINPDLPASALVPPKWPTAKIDLSTPDTALRSLYDALQYGDLDGIGQCLSAKSAKTWREELAKVEKMHTPSGDVPQLKGVPDWKTMWGGFIHGNSGKTTKILLSDRKQTDNTLSARLKTVTDGRPVDLQIRLVKEGSAWKIDNLPDEIMKGYD